jgi:hypothetical protein
MGLFAYLTFIVHGYFGCGVLRNQIQNEIPSSGFGVVKYDLLYKKYHEH